MVEIIEEEIIKAPLPYSVLIELDLDFNVGAGQDVQLPRPGEIISAGFTEFNGYQPDKYLVIEEPRGEHTLRTLRSQDKETFDYWDGTGFITVDQSKDEIKTRKTKARKDAREIEEGPEVVAVDTSDFIKLSTVLGLTIDVPESNFRNEQFSNVFLVTKIDGREFYIPAYTRRL